MRAWNGSSSTSSPGVADDRQAMAERRVERAVDDAEDVVGEAHRRDHAHVDTIAADDLLGADVDGLAGDEPRGRDAVAADVHQRPALQLAREAHVAVALEAEAERGAHDAHAPDALSSSSSRSRASAACGAT